MIHRDVLHRARVVTVTVNRLAVYGTLAPGESNHHMVESLSGRWRAATVRGHRFDAVWRGMGGYPGFVVDPTSEELDILVFESDELVSYWPALDEFEGPGYRRRGAEVRLESGEAVTAQVYQTVLREGIAFATYGTLAPGEVNHWVTRQIPGTWLPAVVRGYRYELTWGPAQGFPGLTLDAEGHRVPVEVLVSTELEGFWSELERFEGPGYVRRGAELFSRDGGGDDDGGPVPLGTATVFESLDDP